MAPPLTPASVDELARISAEEYRLTVEQMTWMIETCERFDPSHKTLAVARALLSQNVTASTIVNAVIQADAAVSQEPEHFQS